MRARGLQGSLGNRHVCIVGPVPSPGGFFNGLLRETIGVTRRIPAFEMHLVNAIVAALDEEIPVKADPTASAGVQLRHPTADAVGIELLVPRGVQRVREINALAVAAYFDHLRAASQWLVRILRMRRAAHNAADPHRTGLA